MVMFRWIKRTLAVATAVSLASISAPTYTLAASDRQSGITIVQSNHSSRGISRRLRDPYQQAALRLMIHGMLDGRMLPNGRLTVRLNQPMTGGDAMNLLARALGKDDLARRLSFRAPERTTEEEWLKGALLAAEGRMISWGAPIRPVGGDAILHTPITVVASIALLMMALGVEPRGDMAWPDNILRTATETGVVARGDTRARPSEVATRGSTFVILDWAFSFHVNEGKTVYTRYQTNAILSVGPYPGETKLDKIPLSGAVSGSTQLKVVKDGQVIYTFMGNGQWSVKVPLTMGANLIEIQGTATNGSHYVQDPPVIITRVAN